MAKKDMEQIRILTSWCELWAHAEKTGEVPGHVMIKNHVKVLLGIDKEPRMGDPERTEFLEICENTKRTILKSFSGAARSNLESCKNRLRAELNA